MGAKRWRDDEDAVLRDVAERGLDLSTQMHRLPLRTYFGARAHARLLGLSFGVTPWSEHERSILRQIYRSDESIKCAAARRLPHRTYSMVKSEASRLGLAGTKLQRGGYGYSAIFRRIELALAGRRTATTLELASELRVSVSGVSSAIAKQHGKRIRVGSWPRATNGGLAAGWTLGKGADAEKPARKSASAACREWRERQRVRAGHVDPFASLVRQVAA